MRNSREITQVGKTVKSESGGRKITKIIDYLEVWKSSITSYLPTIFPVTEETLNEEDLYKSAQFMQKATATYTQAEKNWFKSSSKIVEGLGLAVKYMKSKYNFDFWPQTG